MFDLARPRLVPTPGAITCSATANREPCANTKSLPPFTSGGPAGRCSSSSSTKRAFRSGYATTPRPRPRPPSGEKKPCCWPSGGPRPMTVSVIRPPAESARSAGRPPGRSSRPGRSRRSSSSWSPAKACPAGTAAACHDGSGSTWPSGWPGILGSGGGIWSPCPWLA